MVKRIGRVELPRYAAFLRTQLTRDPILGHSRLIRALRKRYGVVCECSAMRGWLSVHKRNVKLTKKFPLKAPSPTRIGKRLLPAYEKSLIRILRAHPTWGRPRLNDLLLQRFNVTVNLSAFREWLHLHKKPMRRAPHLCQVKACTRPVGGYVLPAKFRRFQGDGFCESHGAMIGSDLGGLSMKSCTFKLNTYIDAYKPKEMIFVRRFGRPNALCASSQKYGTAVLGKDTMSLITMDDPAVMAYMRRYVEEPERYLLVPKGAHRAVEYAMGGLSSLVAREIVAYRAGVFMDDNLLSLAVRYKDSWYPLSRARCFEVIDRGIETMIMQNLWAFSVNCKQNPILVRGLSGSDPSVNYWFKSKEYYLGAERGAKLVFGGFFGLRVCGAPKLTAILGKGGSDDVERTMRHVLYAGDIVYLERIFARKPPMNQLGGQRLLYGSVAKRQRALLSERRRLFRWLLRAAKASGERQNLRKVMLWVRKSKFLKMAAALSAPAIDRFLKS